jgi:hypothetical protein
LIITGRTELDQAFEVRFKAKLYHLDKELIDTIAALTPPVVDTEKERTHIFDSLTRIFIESMDNGKLENRRKFDRSGLAEATPGGFGNDRQVGCRRDRSDAALCSL